MNAAPRVLNPKLGLFELAGSRARWAGRPGTGCGWRNEFVGAPGGAGEGGGSGPRHHLGGAYGPAWDSSGFTLSGAGRYGAVSSETVIGLSGLGLLFVKMYGPCPEEEEAWAASGGGRHQNKPGVLDRNVKIPHFQLVNDLDVVWEMSLKNQ